MLETLISLLIVIALILFILDYLGVIEIVQAFVGLILGAVWLIGKGLMYLYRRLFRASPAPPQGQDQIQDQIQDRIQDQGQNRLKSPSAVWRGRGDRMRSAVSRKPRSD